MGTIGAISFGTLAYLEPITVVALAWVLFDQSLTGLQVSRCALIILSGMAQALLLNRKAGGQRSRRTVAELGSAVS